MAMEGSAEAIYSRERYRFAISLCAEGNKPCTVRQSVLSIFSSQLLNTLGNFHWTEAVVV